MWLTNIKSKMFLIKKAEKIFENWYQILLIYLNLSFNEYSIINTKKNNLHIKIRNRSTDLMALSNVWLNEEYKKEDFEIKDNDVIIDIGGHIGLFNIYASQFCKTGKIFSYEPIKENFNLLKENLKINGLDDKLVFNYAVSSINEKIKIFLSTDFAAHSMHIDTGKNIFVQSTTLEKIFEDNQIDKCNLLKLDCEGSEFEILKKLKEYYFKKIEKIILEYHIYNNNMDIDEIKLMLENYGFFVEVKPTSEIMGMLYANKK